jgi:hypothetical protein
MVLTTVIIVLTVMIVLARKFVNLYFECK